MRSPEEFDEIRRVNRAAMGLAGVEPLVVRGVRMAPLGTAGLGDGILGAALGAAGPIRVASAFPAVSVEWDPRTMAQSQEQGSWLSEWLTVHVVRPEVEFAGVRYAPGDGKANYSWLARVLAWVLGTGAVVGGAWVAYRAFGPSRRANRGSRYYVSSRRAA